MIICGETVIKPYFYLRNGYLHVRYTVDKAIDLSKTEELKVKDEMTQTPYNKQKILKDTWNFLTGMVCKPVIEDGLAEVNRRLKERKNGFKNKGSSVQ